MGNSKILIVGRGARSPILRKELLKAMEESKLETIEPNHKNLNNTADFIKKLERKDF